MHRISSQQTLTSRGLVRLTTLFAVVSPGAILASPYVEFDFARTAECRDVTPAERLRHYPHQRLVEFTLPISVRFRGVESADVEELTVEISGAAAGLLVHNFAPATILASDVAKDIETTTTTKSTRSLDATLGGALPVPFAAKVANVTPSISGEISSGDTMTEKLNRLPPKQAVVISGTSLEGRGVFYKLKPSSQTSLEGVHELAVTFIVPAGWRGGDIHVGCKATGERTVLFIRQSSTLGSELDVVRLYLTNSAVVHRVAKRTVVEKSPRWQSKRAAVTAAEQIAIMVQAASTATAKPQATANSD